MKLLVNLHFFKYYIKTFVTVLIKIRAYKEEVGVINLEKIMFRCFLVFNEKKKSRG